MLEWHHQFCIPYWKGICNLSSLASHSTGNLVLMKECRGMLPMLWLPVTTLNGVSLVVRLSLRFLLSLLFPMGCVELFSIVWLLFVGCTCFVFVSFLY